MTKQLGRKNRKAIIMNAGHVCASCKETRIFSDGKCACQIDHIIPVALGGTNDKQNLQVLCKWCHDKKTYSDRYKISFGKEMVICPTVVTMNFKIPSGLYEKLTIYKRKHDLNTSEALDKVFMGLPV